MTHPLKFRFNKLTSQDRSRAGRLASDATSRPYRASGRSSIRRRKPQAGTELPLPRVATGAGRTPSGLSLQYSSAVA
jgi:hypothetical protein